MSKYPYKIASLSGLVLLSAFSCVLYAGEPYAPWLSQIGLSESISSAANWGKGVKLGVVDTGVYAQSPFFATGQISNKLSSCAAVSFSCSNKFNDDHGHGTAVTAIAAGNRLMPWESNYGGYLVYANSVVSVAPSANIIAQKVLDASGSAYTIDVANGIVKAAKAGASVINVSISYSNSADIVASINYAASKGAYIVWAGGNSANSLLDNADTNGLSNAALNQLIFVGSVNADNMKSDFSNTPGSGNLVGADTQKNYAERWLMAPGENILAPYSISDPSTWGYWTGTSMSAPMVSGSLALLQSTWPILKTNGSAANLLIATSTDLGDAGTDSTYGNGLINLAKAFQPVGALTIKNAKKQMINVSDLNSSIITSGAFGKLAKIKSKLSNYMAFDNYQRNFSVDLSSLIQSPSGSATLNPLPSKSKTKPLAIKLMDGTQVTTWTETASTESEHLGEFNYNSSRETDKQSLFLALNYQDGTTVSLGRGYASEYAYASAFYANDDFANLATELSSHAFANLAEGGNMVNYGMNIGQSHRIAFSWHQQSNNSDNNQVNPSLIHQSMTSNLFKMGLNYQLNSQMHGGITVSYLTEKNGLIGSAIPENASLGFNPNNKSMSVDFALAAKFNEDNMLLLEKGFAFTQSADGVGIVNSISHIHAESFGGTLMSKNNFVPNDMLKISIKQPLRVTTGQAAITRASVDELGYAHYKNDWTDLTPAGKETDYLVSYERNIKFNQLIRIEAQHHEDAVNIKDNNETSVNLYYQLNY